MIIYDKNNMWWYLQSKGWKRYWLSPVPIYNDPETRISTLDIVEAYKIQKARENNEKD